MRPFFRRLIAITLCLSMVLSNFPGLTTSVDAVEDAVESAGLCAHHKVHTAECGYVEPVEGQPCAHVHDAECGYVEEQPCAHVHDGDCGLAVLEEEIPCDLGCIDEDGDGVVDHADDCAYTPAVVGVPCDLDCTDEDGDGVVDHGSDCAYSPVPSDTLCAHEHDAVCGYAEEVPCAHTHDEDCGYVEAVEGHPCEFFCEICGVIVTDWAWVDPYGLLLPGADYGVTDVDWVLGWPNLEEDDLQALLPAAVTAVLKTGDVVQLPITWDFDNKQEYVWTRTLENQDEYAVSEAQEEESDLTAVITEDTEEIPSAVTAEDAEYEAIQSSENIEELEEIQSAGTVDDAEIGIVPSSGTTETAADDDISTMLPETGEQTAIPAEETVSGFYLITAELPEGYSLDKSASELTVLVQMMEIVPLYLEQPNLQEEDLLESMHFIVRYWHNELKDVTFGNAGTSGKGVDGDWQFVVAEGYIVPHKTLVELDNDKKITWGKGHSLEDNHNYEFFVVKQDNGSGDNATMTEASYVSVNSLAAGLDAGQLALLEDTDDSVYITSMDHGSGVIKLNAPDSTVESFAGYSVSAGHSAVKTDEEEITITYDSYVHLVKSHAFYLNDKDKKLGTNDKNVFPATDGIQDDPEQDTSWVYLNENKEIITDSTGKMITKADVDAESENGGSTLKDLVDGGTLTKIYSTTVGLHTDKTATARADEVSAGSTRTFDVELESWYTEGFAPQVGMVLDASGSMIFAADTPSEITLSQAQISALNINTVSGAVTDWSKYFLTDDQIDAILDSHNTDNSALGSGGYSYFVKDGNGDYQPLGYWEGSGAVSPAAQLTFTNTIAGKTIDDASGTPRSWLYDSVTDTHASRVDQVDLNGSYKFVKTGITSWPSGDLKFSSGSGLQVAHKDNQAGVLLDVKPTGGNFTITFTLRSAVINTDEIIEMLYIGPLNGDENSGYFRLYRDSGDSSTRLKGNQKSGSNSTVINVNNVFNMTSVASTYKTITLVFENADKPGGTVSIYIDGKVGDSGTENSNYQQTLSNPITDANIILAGIKDSYTYANKEGDDAVDIDDFTLYNFAASSDMISSLGSTTAPAVARTADGKLLGSLNGVSQTSAGWYLVSHGGDYELFEDPGTAKRLYGVVQNVNFTGDSHGSYTQGNENTPSKFYVDKDGKLRGFFMSSANATSAIVSYVYKLTDQQYIRTEVLQRALGAFVAELYEESSTARVSAVRFSTERYNANTKIDSDPLLMLNWTSDPAEALSIMSLKRGDGSALGNDAGQYNYVLTGSTHTYKGLQAYMDILKTYDMPDGAVAGDDVPKYLIIFTDGADSGEKNSDTRKTSKDIAAQLKQDGYTIYTVVLGEEAILNDGKDTKQFLIDLSGNKDSNLNADGVDLSTNKQYYFSTASTGSSAKGDLADQLTQIFTSDILNDIVQPLNEFTVQDYIDPRFDLVDADGNVWHLNANGKVEGGSAGERFPISPTVDPDDPDYNAQEDTSNPYLRYDSKKDMYFLEWTDQSIPKCTVGADGLYVWSAKFTIRAKEDFIGGNAVLTNGNEAYMNWVFSPEDLNGGYGIPASSGTDDAVRKTTGSVTDADYNYYPSKGFPRTSVNVTPPREDVALEQTIYMGETLDKTKIAQDIIDAAQKDAKNGAENYWEYIYRFVKYFNNLIDNGDLDDEDGVINTLHRMNRLGEYIPEDQDDDLQTGHMKIISNRIYEIMKKGELSVDNLSELLISPDSVIDDGGGHGEDEGSKNKDNYLYIPYIYLPDDPTAQTNSTGTDIHKVDVLGYLYFHIEEQYEENGTTYPKYPGDETGGVTTDTKTRKSALTVSFAVRDPNRRAEWNNGQVIQETTDDTQPGLVPIYNGEYGWSNNNYPTRDEVEEKRIYKRNVTYKPAAGIATDESKRVVVEGTFTTYIVSGEIQLQTGLNEKLTEAEWKKIVDQEITYVANLTRTYYDADGNEVKETVGQLKLTGTIQEDGTIKITEDNESKTPSVVFVPANSKYAYMGYEPNAADTPLEKGQYGLPYGVYTLETLKAECKVPDHYSFGSLKVITDTKEYTAPPFRKGTDYDEAKNYLATKLTDTSADLSNSLTDEVKEDDYTDFRFALFQTLLEGVGDLSITKTVLGDLTDGAYTHKDEQFEFTVTLYEDEEYKTVAKDVNATYSLKDGNATSVTFTNGVATVYVKHGQTVTIQDLTAGYYYKVEEADDSGYITTPDGDTEGRIDVGADLNAEFTNQAIHSLTVEKLVTGSEGDQDKAWTFEIELTFPDGFEPQDGFAYTGGIVSGATRKDNKPIVSPEDGTLSLTKKGGTENTYTGTITLKHGQTITIPNLPCGTKYTVTEQKDQTGDDEYATTVNREHTTVGSGTLNKDDTLRYVNSNPAGGIFISKEVVSPDDSDFDKEFTFTIELSDKTVNGTFKCSGTGAPASGVITFKDGVATVTLKHGQMIHIEYTGDNGNQISPNCTVTVTETDEDGFKTTNTVTVTDYSNGNPDPVETPVDGDTSGSAKVENIEYHCLFEFTNTRKLHDLTLTKYVTGNMAQKSATFDFTIALKNNNGGALSGTFSILRDDETEEEITFDADGKATVTLGNGQSITIKDLPEGIAYEIVEQGAEEYKTTVKVDDKTPANGKTATGTIEDDTSITYYNNLTGTIPTNATTVYRWLIPLFLLLGMGMFVLWCKRRKRSVRQNE